MNTRNIAVARLRSLQIAGTKFKSVQQVVKWLGALQSQDFAMSKWAIGARLPESTEALVDKAIDNGDIIRTHLLRPTWHLVAAEDLHWMLELTAPQVKAVLKSRDKELGLSESIYKKANIIIKRELKGGNHLAREALLPIFKKDKIATGDNRASHLFLRAELEGVICSGKIQNGKHSYALLDERVSPSKTVSREDGLQMLANRYFASRGPATLQDFKWWSGLSVKDATNALEMVATSFDCETIEKERYYFNGKQPAVRQKRGAFLLPAFDEFIISYKNRSASLELEHAPKAISVNGLFRPVIVLNGSVAGLWKRSSRNDKLLVEATFFASPIQASKEQLKKESQKFGKFLGAREVELLVT